MISLHQHCTMKLKNYCRRVLYVTPQDKVAPPKLKAKESVEEDSALKSSDDEEAVQTEDATLPAPHNRPPSYNPEDYAQALTRFSRSQTCYIPEPARDKKGRVLSGGGRDPKCSSNGISRDAGGIPEMTTRQFSSLPELLKNLRDDLSVAYISFVKEVVREPHDCAWLLLDLLRTIQHAQTALHSTVSSREQQTALRRALLDEHSCLCCLRYCLRCADTAPKLAEYQHGLYALTVATMSNLARSRTIALQLLTRVCDSSATGHRQVLDALATLRLRFAESVRCKFLVSMLQSHPTPSFAVWSLRLLNALVSSAESLRQRIHLQEELIEAGFDPAAVKKTVERNGVEGASFSAIQKELERWNSSYVDITELGQQLDSLHFTNKTLTHELSGLREANMKLLEENVLLKAVGGEVQEQYIALQRRLETNGLPSAPSPIPSVTDSDISSIGPVRRGTVLRRPSRSSSSRSFNADATLEKTDKHQRSSTPDILPERITSHVNSDTFTYASGHGMLKELVPQPLPRSTSLHQTYESSAQVFDIKDFEAQNNWNDKVENTVIAPCYVNPMDIRKDEIDMDDTLNRYTPPMMTQRQIEPLPTVHQKSSVENLAKITSGKSGNRRTNSPKNRTICQPSLKRKAPKVPSSNSSSPLSSSTSSLSSASSSASSNGGARRNSPQHQQGNGNAKKMQSLPEKNDSDSGKHMLTNGSTNDPDYQNIPRRTANERSESQCSEDRDYEQDTVVYEAITMSNDMIELVSRGSSSGSSSQTSSANRQTRRPGSSNSINNQTGKSNPSRALDNYIQLKNNINDLSKQKTTSKLDNVAKVFNVRKSVKHYENLAIAEAEHLNLEVEKQNKKNKLYANSNEGNSNDCENDAIMKSADSSISLDSQDTVKENNALNRSCEDRASPDGRNSDELEIVPSRQPQMPNKLRSSSSPSCDPIMFFEFDSPAETSDTETLNRQCPSPRTMETESTRSFGFIQPEKGLRRRDTLIEHSNDTTKEKPNNRRRGLKRSESFQAGDSSDLENTKGYVVRRRGSTDLLIDTGLTDQQEVYINGRTFTKYTPQDVIINNEVNELLTAALNRRQCRSVEDRLDQWLEEDLRRHNPENLQQNRNRLRNNNKKRESGRSASSFDDNRHIKLDKNNNKNKISIQHKQGKSKALLKRFSNSDLIAFNGFMNPSTGFIESDYGPNFMLNKPTSKRKTEFLGDTAEFGVHDFPANNLHNWSGDGRWPALDADPDIPTPDYGATPAGTLTPAVPGSIHHILNMPSGLY